LGEPRRVWGQGVDGSGCGSAFDDPGDDPCHCLPPFTRPTSSRSSFEFVNPTRAPTPFELTPATSPDKPSDIPLPESQPTSPQVTMSSEPVHPFYGDKKDENPASFMRSFHRRMGTATDDVKKQQFPNFLEPDSVADEWFEELTPVDTKDWNAIEAAFHKRWPRKKAVKKTTEEYEQEITNLRIKMEDVGKKETVAGREVYSHIAWADDMAAIVRGAKLETTTTFIGHVRKELPKLLREKVGTGHADWTAFLQAVRDIDRDHIREGVDIWRKEEDMKRKEHDTRKKEVEDHEAIKRRIQQLEALSASPTAPLRQQMTTFGIGNTPASTGQPFQQTAPAPTNPFASNAGGRGNLFYSTQARTPQQNFSQRPTPTQADRVALLLCLQKYPHLPDTEAGRLAHQAQQADWAKTHGLNAVVSETTPYPLRPGTLPVGSGECFTCGFLGHMGRKDGSTCGGNRALHRHEQTWRAICSRIIRQTRNPANIQLVTVDDYGTTWQDVQGKEDGPSN
jgi:hypothetical protein